LRAVPRGATKESRADSPPAAASRLLSRQKTIVLEDARAPVVRRSSSTETVKAPATVRLVKETATTEHASYPMEVVSAAGIQPKPGGPPDAPRVTIRLLPSDDQLHERVFLAGRKHFCVWDADTEAAYTVRGLIQVFAPAALEPGCIATVADVACHVQSFCALRNPYAKETVDGPDYFDHNDLTGAWRRAATGVTLHPARDGVCHVALAIPLRLLCESRPERFFRITAAVTYQLASPARGPPRTEKVWSRECEFSISNLPWKGRMDRPF